MKSIYYETQELSRDISSLNTEMYFDENDRNQIEERLDIIYSLKRKYGNSIEEILEYKDKIEKEIERINNLDEYNEKLRKKEILFRRKMISIANNMHDMREKMADKIK